MMHIAIAYDAYRGQYIFATPIRWIGSGLVIAHAFVMLILARPIYMHVCTYAQLQNLNHNN